MSWLSKAFKSGAAFGFIGDLAGGLLEHSSTKDANKMTMDAAKNSISWRVSDAKRAGVHPIYALGSPGISVSPQVMSGGYLSSMGQNIDRARMAAADRSERAAVRAAAVNPMQGVMDKLSIENAALQNDYLRSQIARLQADQVGPPAPSLNMGGLSPNASRVVPLPAQPIINSPYNSGREAGNITDYGYSRTDSGGLAIVPSMDVKNRIEDNIIQELAWAFRNQVLPAFRGLRRPTTREFPLPAGYEWRWNAMAQEFRPYNTRVVRPHPRVRSQRGRDY